MSDKRIKVIYFSTGGSEVRHANFSWRKFCLIGIISFAIIMLVVGSVFAVFTDFYHNFKIESLSRVNTILTQQLSEMDNKVRDMDKRMGELEMRDNDLRVFVNLPKIDEETWKVGAGGSYSTNDYELRFLSKETGDQTLAMNLLLEKIQRQVDLAQKSQKDIERAANEKKELWAHTPSIQPVAGRISERFGMRLDPFIEKVQHHYGIDIPAEVGTKIHASADGVVEEVQNGYLPNKGYGKYLVVDHGDGFKTKYAHLHNALVREGEVVKRWQVIAEVGNTGRSTGPHLHYEVIQQDRPIDPVKYIFN